MLEIKISSLSLILIVFIEIFLLISSSKIKLLLHNVSVLSNYVPISPRIYCKSPHWVNRFFDDLPILDVPAVTLSHSFHRSHRQSDHPYPPQPPSYLYASL